MKHGRLQSRAISYHADLSERQVKYGAAVLLQQNLAVWSTDTESNDTIYEARWTAAYALVRTGKLLRAVESRFGENVKSLFTNCLLASQFKVSDLEKGIGLQHTRTTLANCNSTDGRFLGPSKAKTNGELLNPSDYLTAIDDFHSKMYTLLHNRFLNLAHEAHFRPDWENLLLAEHDIRQKSEYSDKQKKKDQPIVKLAIEDTLRSWLQGSLAVRTAIKNQTLDAIDDNLKRPFKEFSDAEEDDLPGLTKRRRLADGLAKVNGALADSIERRQSRIPSNTTLRVNEQKSAVTCRSDKLAQLAQERIGAVTAEVYSKVLMHFEQDIHQCNDTTKDVESPPTDDNEQQPRVSTKDVVTLIANNDRLQDSIGRPDPSSPNSALLQHRKEHRRKRQGTRQVEVEATEMSDEGGMWDKPIQSLESDQEERIWDGLTREENSSEHGRHFKLVRQHLLLLAQSPLHFLHHHRRTTTQPESWSVPFRALSEHLRLIELNRCIASVHGKPALRIVRLLQESGKLDEKSIRQRVLHFAKENQSTITSLLSAGKIEVQEVPRDNNRQPHRTIWLYFFDADRCGRKVLEETYQAMSRCLQRLRLEREVTRDVLNKAARTDVVGREKELLSKGDLAALTHWKDKEERLLGELGRLDDTVLVLRDFQGL